MTNHYTVEEVAERLKVSKRTILREIKKGKMVTSRAGRRHLISEKSINDYLLVRGRVPDIHTQINDYIYSRKSEMVSLLQRLVAIPSESENGKNDNLADYVKKFLIRKGLRTVVYGKGDSIVVRGTAGFARNGILLDCPMDSAPVGDISKWKHSPFDGAIDGGKMYGRGTADCKAGMVAMIYASLALKEFVKEEDFRVEMVFDGGEHSGAYEGMRETLRRGLDVSAGVVGYGGSGNEIAIGCRGYHRYKITSFGHAVHSGAGYSAGVNAISNMAALISGVDGVVFPKPDDKYFSFGSKLNFTMLEGGAAINMVPDECTAYLDVRTTPNVGKRDVDMILNKVIESAKRKHKGMDLKYEYLLGQEGYRVGEDEKIVSSLQEAVGETTGEKPGLIVHGPAHVGTVMAEMGVPVVVYGPEGGNVHSYDEFVEVGSLMETSLVYVNTVRKFFSEN
jgi:succinyl-diaminopimelate desuccinylase